YCCVVPVSSPFLLEVVKKLRHFNHRRPQGYEKDRREDEKNERKDQLDGGLGGLFFDLLAAFGSECVGMDAQGSGDAGSEFFGLYEHGDEIADAIDVGAVSKTFPGLCARFPGGLFEDDDAQFVAEVGLSEAKFLGSADGCLIKAEAGFDADDHEVKDVRQAPANAALAEDDLPAEPHVRGEISDAGGDEKQKKRAEAPGSSNQEKGAQDDGHEKF